MKRKRASSSEDFRALRTLCVHTSSPLQILSTQLPTLCSSLSRALKHHSKHQLTVQAIFKLLRELIKTMGGDSTLASLFTPFWPLIINSLKNGGATALRVDALSLISHVVSTLPVTEETLEHGPALIKAIALCVTDSYFKVVVDACNVAAVLAGKSATWKLDSVGVCVNMLFSYHTSD